MLPLNTKKKALRELWSCRVGTEGADVDVVDREWSDRAHGPWKRFMKRREAKELIAFAQTLRRGGTDQTTSPCWPLPTDPVEVCGEAVAPELLCSRLFRWADLRAGDSLRRIGVRGVCEYGARDLELEREEQAAAHSSRSEDCCNPYHFGRLLRCDLAPLELLTTRQPVVALRRGRSASDARLDSLSEDQGFSGSDCLATFSFRSRNTDRIDSELVPQRSYGRRWLSGSYWEYHQRLGEQFHCDEAQLSVCYDVDRGDKSKSFRLAKIRNAQRRPETERRRRDVGCGFIVWRQKSAGSHVNVWMYNRSRIKLYIQSATISNPDTPHLEVKCLPPGYVVKVFDGQRAQPLEEIFRRRGRRVDVFQTRVSLSSPWGNGRDLISCPCYLEMFYYFGANEL